MEAPQTIKNGTALWHSSFTFGDVFEETQNTNAKEYMPPPIPIFY